MERKYVQEYWREHQKVKVFLNNNDIYTGVIIEVGDDTILFQDKFNREIPISLDAISHIVPMGDVK